MVAGIAVLMLGAVAVVAFFAHRLYVSSPDYRRGVEQDLVEKVVPGETYEKLKQTIGTGPDYSFRLPTGNTIHQYERQWETLQLLENASGMVLSVGVYAKDKEFKPTVALGGQRITLNAPVDRAAPRFLPAAANAYCGAHKSGYFEGYFPMPNAFKAMNFVVGASNAESELDLRSMCGQLGGTLCSAPQVPTENALSPEFAECLLATPGGQRIRRETAASVIVYTAPGAALVDDMLFPPDVVAAGAVNFR